MTRVLKFLVVALITIVATEVTTDAQVLKNLLQKATSSSTTEQTTSGTVNGKAAGVALKAIYKQYKADGKLDIKNLTNIANIATLATNIAGLKGLTDKSTFYMDFVSGLILGSENLVNQGNSSTIMGGLLNLANNVDLSNIAGILGNAKTSSSGEASELTSSLTSILGLLK